jgi:hypothetical protein
MRRCRRRIGVGHPGGHVAAGAVHAAGTVRTMGELRVGKQMIGRRRRLCPMSGMRRRIGHTVRSISSKM